MIKSALHKELYDYCDTNNKIYYGNQLLLQ